MSGSNARDATRNSTTAEAFMKALKSNRLVMFDSVYAIAIVQKRETDDTYQKLSAELGLGPLPSGQIDILRVTSAARKAIEDAKKDSILLEGGTGSTAGAAIAGGQTPVLASSAPAKAIVSANSIWPDPSYRYNLPPHAWTRLTRTTPVEPPRDKQDFNPNKDVFHPRINIQPQLSSLGASRRGLIWWYQAQVQDETVVSDSANLNDAAIEKAILTDNNQPDNRKFGLMFPWNPTEVSFTTALAPDAKDSANDDYLGYAGAPGAQTMQLSLTINRQDDFACLAGLAEAKGVQIPQLEPEDFSSLRQYYIEDSRLYTESKVPLPDDKYFNSQMKELAIKGSLHDVEYLYRTINGKGWKKFGLAEIGKLGSADVGYLMFTLVNIAIGPMVYSGVIRGISVNHVQFSNNMTPIISTIGLTIDIRSTLAMNTSVGTTSSTATAGEP